MSPLRPERKKRKRSNEERILDSGLGLEVRDNPDL
jgi:hypothetical protein